MTMWHKIHPGLNRNYFEDVILYARYLLYPMYVVLLFGICIISLDFVKELMGLETNTIADIFKTLELLDITMIANLVWYVSAGSYYVFVHTYNEHVRNDNQPRVLLHLSSGLLKEKLAGSLVGVSSVHLLKTFLTISTTEGVLDFGKLFAMAGIHILFLTGVLVFNFANCKSESVQQNEHKEKEHA
jgi:uncharacterized protein (TIGR00645 family)